MSIEQFPDPINTKVGANTDSSGTSTLFARLAQISAYVDTLETLVGTTGDAAGTGSLFAFQKKLDAKATGAAVDRSACIPFASPAAGTVSLTSSYQTLYNYTGKGFLDSAIIQRDAGGGFIVTIRITVDGVVKFEGQNSTSGISSSWSGVINVDKLGFSGSNLVFMNNTQLSTITVLGTSVAIVDYPYTANAVFASKGTLAFPTNSIYFNSSILIEAKADGVVSGINYAYAGGRI